MARFLKNITPPSAAMFLAATFVFVASIAFYADPVGLNGEFVYDDKGTVVWNPTVKADAAWSDLLVKDFWGKDDLTSPASHKRCAQRSEPCARVRVCVCVCVRYRRLMNDSRLTDDVGVDARFILYFLCCSSAFDR